MFCLKEGLQIAGSHSGLQLVLLGGTDGIDITLGSQVGPLGVVLLHDVGEAVGVVIIQALGGQAGGGVVVIDGVEALAMESVVGPDTGVLFGQSVLGVAFAADLQNGVIDLLEGGQGGGIDAGLVEHGLVVEEAGLGQTDGVADHAVGVTILPCGFCIYTIMKL